MARVDTTWMWHPSFSEEQRNTAGLFVHFRKTINFTDTPPPSLRIHVTADTRYKLYVNRRLAHFGPVKGDEHLWFFDEVDIGPLLHPGENCIAVVVLRYFYATEYATSFPRLPWGGLRIVPAEAGCLWEQEVRSGDGWETAVDRSRTLRVDEPEDEFLHVYERIGVRETWEWVPAKVQEWPVMTGNAAPWNLSPRLVPPMTGHDVYFRGVRNVKGSLSADEWQAVLAPKTEGRRALRLPPNSRHVVDLEAPTHLTAFIRFRFARPESHGSKLTIKYSESYEDKPLYVPYIRSKGHRLDDTKSLYGPKDIYEFEGPRMSNAESYDESDETEETFAPFHWRTFRLLQLELEVGPSELVLLGLDMKTANYPLETRARIETPDDDLPAKLWDTSLRTLKNCMHDCYEDCPLYEQFQYAMDARSSILFTYYASGDDRLARQAIVQLHNSFQPVVGLTRSRAPSHKAQFIPHFSLFWVLMLADHMRFFKDEGFVGRFLPAADAVLGYFGARVDPDSGLVTSETRPGIWNFVDWAEGWRPYGVPPAAERTGVSTYTNLLYAVTLKAAARVQTALGRAGVADEYLSRASDVTDAARTHCFDGEFFTDSLAAGADKTVDYSQHSQAWAVLAGAVADPQEGQRLLRACLAPGSGFTPASVSMSFYTLRALSAAGGKVYNEIFGRFWDPWRAQLGLGLETWEEDPVSHRSDCHAWGSAPVYEFAAEVAGVRPLGDGWDGVEVRPRVGLYARFSAVVPMGAGGGGGGVKGLVRVEWRPEGDEGAKRVSLRVEMEGGGVVCVRVCLPGESGRMMRSDDDLTFLVS